MLSYQIKEYYEFALNKLEKFEKIAEILFEFEKNYQDLSHNVLRQILSEAKGEKDGFNLCYVLEGNSLIEEFEKLNKKFRKNIKLRQITEGFSEYKKEITEYRFNRGISDLDAETLLIETDKMLSELYDCLLRSDERSEYVVLTQKLHAFVNQYTAFKNNYINVLKMFNFQLNEGDIPPHLSTIEIQLLERKFTFDEFIRYLMSIREIYHITGEMMYGEVSF